MIKDLFFNNKVSEFKTTQALTDFLRTGKLWIHSSPVYIGKEFLEHGQAHSLHIMYFLRSLSFF